MAQALRKLGRQVRRWDGEQTNSIRQRTAAGPFRRPERLIRHVRFGEPAGQLKASVMGANRPESRPRRKLSSPPTAVVDEFRTSQRLGSMRFLLLDAFSST